MIIETSVSKRTPIPGLGYSSQSYSITVREDEVVGGIETVKEKSIIMHGFLEKIINERLGLDKPKSEIVAISQSKVSRAATKKQLDLIHKLLAENPTLEMQDLIHAMESAYHVNSIEKLTTLEASSIIEAIMAKDLSKL